MLLIARSSRLRARRPAGAFTLIEVLVVVAIIALLLAILLPSLAKAKEMARRAACLSNLHQLGVGMATYSVDYQGLLPTREEFSYYIKSNYDTANYGILYDMRTQMNGGVRSYSPRGRYIGRNHDLFYCPGFVQVAKMTDTWEAYGQHTFLDPQVKLSFGGYIYATPLAPGHCPTLRRKDIYSPRGVKEDGGAWHPYYKKWLTTDVASGGKGFASDTTSASSYMKYQPPPIQAVMADQIIGGPESDWVKYLHKDGVNALFQDTHARFVNNDGKRTLNLPASSGPNGCIGLYTIWEFLGRRH